MSKGFRARKTPTKQELIEGQGSVIDGLKAQVQVLMNTQIQLTKQLQNKLQAVDNELNAMASVLHMTEVDGPAASGDAVMIDFIGRLLKEDGTPEVEHFEGGHSRGHVLMNLGAYNFLKDFEDQLFGKKAGDQITAVVTFPADYHVKPLAGKPAQFDIGLIKVWREPSVSSFVLGHYEASVKAKIEKQEAAKAQ